MLNDSINSSILKNAYFGLMDHIGVTFDLQQRSCCGFHQNRSQIIVKHSVPIRWSLSSPEEGSNMMNQSIELYLECPCSLGKSQDRRNQDITMFMQVIVIGDMKIFATVMACYIYKTQISWDILLSIHAEIMYSKQNSLHLAFLYPNCCVYYNLSVGS